MAQGWAETLVALRAANWAGLTESSWVERLAELMAMKKVEMTVA